MTEQQAVWSINETTSIKSYTLMNFRNIPQIQEMRRLMNLLWCEG